MLLTGVRLLAARIILFLGKCNQLLTLRNWSAGEKAQVDPAGDTMDNSHVLWIEWHITVSMCSSFIHHFTNFFLSLAVDDSMMHFLHRSFSLYKCVVYRNADHHLQAWANSVRRISKQRLVTHLELKYVLQNFHFHQLTQQAAAKVEIILSFVFWSVAIGSGFMAPTMGGGSKYSFRPCSFLDPFVVGSTRLNVKDFDSNLEVLCYENRRCWVVQCFLCVCMHNFIHNKLIGLTSVKHYGWFFLG